jgi:glutamate formiminotransferase
VGHDEHIDMAAHEGESQRMGVIVCISDA